MYYIEPNTTIEFLNNIDLDPTYENTLYFPSVAAQDAYFIQRVQLRISAASYQRAGKGIIKVSVASYENNTPTISLLYNVHYMRFKNTNFENKWFYAFVDKVEYVNNNTVSISYAIDVIQTWLLQTTFNQCLIEREHTVTDVVGDNTVAESLETGPYLNEKADYVLNNTTYTDGRFHYTPSVCLITSFPIEIENQPTISLRGKRIFGLETEGTIYSGCYYTIILLNAEGVTALNNIIEQITEDTALADGLLAIFMTTWEFRMSIVAESVADPQVLHFDVRTVLNGNYGYYIDDYVVRNKKLMCAPYNFLYVSNNQGNSQELHWEDFQNFLDAKVQIWGNVSGNGGLISIPVDYKDANGRNYDEAMELTGFQLCSFTYDSFKAWLAQNAGYIGATATNIASDWITYFGANLPANASVFGRVFNAVGEIYDHSRKPPQQRGNTNTSLTEQAGMMTFNFYRKHIKKEYAKIIDSYFDMYGYKTNRVGVPILDARPCYNYVKTIGCSISGNAPSDAEREIEKIFDNGVRFWSATAVFGNYASTVNNNQPRIA